MLWNNILQGDMMMCGRYYIDVDGMDMQEILAALGHDERIKAGEPLDSPAFVYPGASAYREA